MIYRKRNCTIFIIRLERRTRIYLSNMDVPDYLSTSSAHGKTFLDQSKYKIIPVKQFPLTRGVEVYARGNLKPQGLCVKKTCFSRMRRGSH